MSNGVTCPNCQTELDLTGLSEIPPSVRCGKCATVFSTVDAAAKSRWRVDDQAAPTAGTQTDLLPPGGPASPAPASGQAASVANPHPDLPPTTSAPNAGGGAGFDPTPPHLRSTPTGAPSAPASSGPAAGGIQLQVDENDAPHRRRMRGGGISAIWLVIGATGLIAIGAVVIAVVYMQRGPFQIAARDADDLPSNRSVEQNDGPGEVRWTDASRYSARIASVKVKVDRIEFGEVRARNEQREVQTSQDDSFFQLYLVIESQRRLPVEYTSWYGNEFEVGDDVLVAQLSDLEGNVFPMLVFRDAFDIHGHTPDATLREKNEIRDTIVFEIPEDVDIANVAAFRLTLPAAAFGEPGLLRFELPESMIDEAQAGSGLLNGDPPGGGGLQDRDDSGGDAGEDDSVSSRTLIDRSGAQQGSSLIVDPDDRILIGGVTNGSDASRGDMAEIAGMAGIVRAVHIQASKIIASPGRGTDFSNPAVRLSSLWVELRPTHSINVGSIG